mgnify:CR=1 FL=1
MYSLSEVAGKGICCPSGLPGHTRGCCRKSETGCCCEDLYNLAIDIVTKAGFADNFMGATQKAKFIGHGIGLEINEMPVLAPRMKQELEPGMVFALEPKIVCQALVPSVSKTLGL